MDASPAWSCFVSWELLWELLCCVATNQWKIFLSSFSFLFKSKLRVQNYSPFLFHNYFFIGDDVDPIVIISPSNSGKDSGLPSDQFYLTPNSISDLNQSRSGGALAGSNTNLASSFNSGLNTVGLNNGYQNQNGDRSGAGSKWGNSSRLGKKVQQWVKIVDNESLISQIMDCPMVEEVEVDHTTGLIQSAVD